MEKKSKEPRKKIEERKRGNIWSLLLILGVTVLFFLFYIFPDNKFKLISGGSFLVLIAIVELLRIRNVIVFFSFLIPGTTALLIAFLLPKYINLFLVLFYLILLAGIILLFYFYVKVGDRFNNEQRKLQLAFRSLYLIISIILTYSIYILINSTIPYYFSVEAISWTDYILFIIAIFASLFSFYLLIDNLIRIFITISGSSEIFPKVSYRAYYSFFLSLSILILVGGKYYINNPSNELFKKLMIIIGLAFFTSLVITSSLRDLLKKDNYSS